MSITSEFISINYKREVQELNSNQYATNDEERKRNEDRTSSNLAQHVTQLQAVILDSLKNETNSAQLKVTLKSQQFPLSTSITG